MWCQRARDHANQCVPVVLRVQGVSRIAQAAPRRLLCFLFIRFGQVPAHPAGQFMLWQRRITTRSTGRKSRYAVFAPVTSGVSPITRSMRAATCCSAPPCSKGFQAFWASSACAANATSYHACSAAPLPWPSAFSWAAHIFKAGRSLLAFGSNSALKRTGFQPAAYLGR